MEELVENPDDIELSDDCEGEVTSGRSQNEVTKRRQHRDTFIAGGVYTDCENILKKFLALKTSTFEDFVKIWKEMKFPLIFNGRDGHSELMEFTEETLVIAKSFILPPHNQIKRIGGLYLMYGVYMQQPAKAAFRFRVTPQEWSVILKFVENLKMHGFLDANYVFHKLCMDGAFLTVAVSREFGLERNYRKYLMPWPDRDQELDPCKSFSLETLMGRVYRGSLKAAADKCRLKYNAIKKNLEATKKSKFQGVKGTESPLDSIMQANLSDSIGNSLIMDMDKIGNERRRIRAKAFSAQPHPEASQSALLKITASTSEATAGKVPAAVTTQEDERDPQFTFLMRPPSMRNSRLLKRMGKKDEKDEGGLKLAPGLTPRQVSYLEVIGENPKRRRTKAAAGVTGKRNSTESVSQLDESLADKESQQRGAEGLSLEDIDADPPPQPEEIVTDKESQQEGAVKEGSEGLGLEHIDVGPPSPVILSQQKGRKRKNTPAQDLVITLDSSPSESVGKATKKKATPRRSTKKSPVPDLATASLDSSPSKSVGKSTKKKATPRRSTKKSPVPDLATASLDSSPSDSTEKAAKKKATPRRSRKKSPAPDCAIASLDSSPSKSVGKSTKKKATPRRSTKKSPVPDLATASLDSSPSDSLEKATKRKATPRRSTRKSPVPDLAIAPQESTASDSTEKATKKKATPRRSRKSARQSVLEV
ncbi:hypothetical protein ONE63_003887 [Megalurothrips usitatus]|uniref:snRNA-activating protein complex subunit 1 n=1 Tax=Megalurothrips usitatus TaxID=439358 RepID=A0AAV7X8P1_9NEOP|nr:hypothetical protein ONE63_003887 [Megalurothrips usitatus]